MTRDEVRKLLGEGATEEQITNVLNMAHTKLNEKDKELKDIKENLNKFSDYDEIKNKLTEIEKSQLTEQEKIDIAKKEATENLKQSKRIVNTARAKEVLAGLNVSEKIIATLVSEDEEKTLENANELANQINLLKENTKKEVEEALANLDVKPPITNKNQNDDKMTFEKFNKLSSEEQAKFAENNPEEFAKL